MKHITRLRAEHLRTNNKLNLDESIWRLYELVTGQLKASDLSEKR